MILPEKWGATEIIATVVVSAVLLIFSLLFFLRTLVFRLYYSVTPQPAVDDETVVEKDGEFQNLLFKYIPGLRGRVAFNPLGSYPTPIHRVTQPVPLSWDDAHDEDGNDGERERYPEGKSEDQDEGNERGRDVRSRTRSKSSDKRTTRSESSSSSSSGARRTVQFFVKREDLSSPYYGGNKVRTMQFQLAAFHSENERRKKMIKMYKEGPVEGQEGTSNRLVVIGSNGSNQCVAVGVHLNRASGLNPSICYFAPDAADLDNALNVLSCLSFPGKTTCFNKMGSLAQVLRAAADEEISTFLSWCRPWTWNWRNRSQYRENDNDSDDTTTTTTTTTATNYNGDDDKKRKNGRNKDNRGGRGSDVSLFPNLPRARVLPPGGNNLCGVLGQMGGALELAEQIARYLFFYNF